MHSHWGEELRTCFCPAINPPGAAPERECASATRPGGALVIRLAALLHRSDNLTNAQHHSRFDTTTRHLVNMMDTHPSRELSEAYFAPELRLNGQPYPQTGQYRSRGIVKPTAHITAAQPDTDAGDDKGQG